MAQQNKNSNQPEGFGGFEEMISEPPEDVVVSSPKVTPAKSVAASPLPSQAKPVTPAPPPAPPRNNPPKPSSPPPQAPTKPEVRVIVEPKPVPSSLPNGEGNGSREAMWIIAIVCGVIFLLSLFIGSGKNQTSSKTPSSMATQSNPVMTPSTTTTRSEPTYSNSVVQKSSPIAPSKLSVPTEITKPSNYQEAIKKWVTDGKAYYWGKNNVKDYQQAFQYFKVAAEEGNAEAQVWLGLLYSEGKGVSKNDAESIQWYRKAADQGNAVAMFNLGLRYSEGRGVTQDKQLATYWLNKAAERGDKDAKKAIKKLNQRQKNQRAAEQEVQRKEGKTADRKREVQSEVRKPVEAIQSENEQPRQVIQNKQDNTQSGSCPNGQICVNYQNNQQVDMKYRQEQQTTYSYQQRETVNKKKEKGGCKYICPQFLGSCRCQ